MTSEIDKIPQNFGNIGKLSLTQGIAALNPATPVSVYETDSLQRAIELLQECHIGCALVVDANGKLNGIFSERDILQKWALSEVPPSEIPVTEIMTPDPASLPSDTTVAAALYTMSKGGFRHLPLTDEAGHPVGIVSVKDVMDFIAMQCMKDMFT